jgi:hypothetical protein
MESPSDHREDMTRTSLLLLSLTAGFAIPGIASAEGAKPDPAGIEFFEKHVRPILVESCYSCHSTETKKLKGSLLLDSMPGLLKGGDTGPSLVPGDPDKSLLVKAIRYTDEDLQMPPKEKLPAERIAAIEAWVKMGAPYPEAAAPQPASNANSHLDIEQMRIFWSFQPPKDHPVPLVKDKHWPQTPIDNFILQKIEEKGLSPSKPADKRTLIRRATFDLIGLPPTPQEVDDFLNDQSADAFAKVVERLLASPHYGERWGRYWLDVARYADSKGYVFEEERRYPYAYTYRDWVIRAFNRDMPYDQFLTYQIAADQAVANDPAKAEHLAALGFLTLGRRFLNNQPDIIDDRIDVVTRGTLAFTVACARCHDHKYDPVPIKDYYSLYGIFASSNEPRDLPLIGGAKTPENESFEKELAKIEAELQAYLKERHKEKSVQLRSANGVEAHLLSVHESGDKSGRELRGIAQKRDLSGEMVERWRAFLKTRAAKHDPVFAPWHALAPVPDAEFAAQASALVASLANPDPEKRINARVAAALKENPPKSVGELAARYGVVLAAADGADAHADPEQEELRQVLRGEKSPVLFPASETEQFLRRDERTRVRDIRKRSESLQASHPGAPARAMALIDNPTPTDPVVFIRGNPGNRGEKVPRQFPAILSTDRKPFTQGSGRLELAQAIASKDNPLTARVIVNRVWLWHFGQGLVRTPSDFGTRGDRPTHPELLDHLAVRFMNEGWSIKNLHRLIMLSSAYQQDSSPIANPKSQIANRDDPENRLLWRMNRRRLEFESMRDSLLFASARLDRKQFGRPVDIVREPFNPRRTIYGYIDRQNLPGMFRAFDFASPDQHSPQRFATTVPQQALFMINSPFVIEQARHVIKRPDIAAAKEASQRITLLYRTLFARDPSPDETYAGIKFIDSERLAHDTSDSGKDAPRLDPWEKYAQVLLVSNEFVFID